MKKQRVPAVISDVWSSVLLLHRFPQSPYYGGIFKLDSPKSIIGGQLNSWGDTLASIPNGLEEEFERILEDAPAIAENTWNKKKRGDYNDFVKCDNHCAAIFRKIIK